MSEVILLILLVIAIWFWQDTLRAREVAVERSRRYCHELKYQFLDETVALLSIKPGRSDSGNFAFQRYYHFEFSPDGQHRFSGTTHLIGSKILSIQLDHPDGIIIEQEKD